MAIIFSNTADEIIIEQKLNRIDNQSEWVDFYICELLIEPKF